MLLDRGHSFPLPRPRSSEQNDGLFDIQIGWRLALRLHPSMITASLLTSLSLLTLTQWRRYTRAGQVKCPG